MQASWLGYFLSSERTREWLHIMKRLALHKGRLDGSNTIVIHSMNGDQYLGLVSEGVLCRAM